MTDAKTSVSFSQSGLNSLAAILKVLARPVWSNLAGVGLTFPQWRSQFAAHTWQGIDRSFVAAAREVKISCYIIFIITFDCQGNSQGGGISARAFSLARPGV